MQSLKKNRLIQPKLLLLLCGVLCGQALLAQSLLAEGTWRKIGVTKSGVYKLDHAFLSRMGMTASSDPETIKVYGPGFAGMLPQPNDVVRSFDPSEIPVYREGAADGRLDATDFVLFYAPGPDLMQMDSAGLVYYEKNVFTDTAWYLVTFGGPKGQSIPLSPAPTVSVGAKSTFRSFVAHEQELVNILQSGRVWLGEEFKASQRQRTFQIPFVEQRDSILLMLRLVGETDRPASFDVFGNDQQLGTVAIDSITGGAYETKATVSSATFRMGINGAAALSLRLQYNRSGPEVGATRAFLDNFVVGYDRRVTFGSTQAEVFVMAAANDRFSMAGATAGSRVWDVTDAYAPSECGLFRENGSGVFMLDGGIRHLVAFEGSNQPLPIDGGAVSNQNIKSLAGSNGIIVTAPVFLAEANRLAQFHRSQGLSVGVATTTQIYQEFSSGQQDITAIRDFLRYCYDQGGLQYALLFGDGSYDYKSRVFGNTNLVPTYQSYDSFHPIFSYASDDYFGFLESHEGQWYEGLRSRTNSFLEQPVNHTLDIGVGRLPAKTLEEARQIVDKIIRYKTSRQALGIWRTQVAYLADDGDFGTHMDHPEQLFNIFQVAHPEYGAKKLYLDAFDQTPGNNSTSPDLRRELQSVIKDGVLVLNYTGHGSPLKLMDESVVDFEFIDQMTNRHKLPLIVTATCDFGKFDDPSPAAFSGAEKLILHPNGGGIALLTTTRPVYAHTNLPLNRAFHQYIFRRIDGELPRLGDVIRQTKNNSLQGVFNRNFTLLGDPMLVLNYPQYDVVFDQLEEQLDTLSALETYRLTGSIVDGDQVSGDFEGVGTVTVWDIPEDKVTKGNQNSPFPYKDQTNALFRGEVTVTEGRFEAEFVLPKNSSYKFESGKISFYAQSSQDLRDASGASSNFVIGGTASDAAPDSRPPVVQLFLNDSTFVNGGTVGSSSLFMARISDESGLNISNNGFNQGMVLMLNEQTIRLNDFYTADRDTYKSGTVLFPLQNLEPGSYTATLKVADTHNNFTTASVTFKVSDQPVLRLFNAGNYPNPASVSWGGRTTFAFEHDRESEELLVEILVYNMQGTQVNHQRYRIDSSPRQVDGLEWPLSNFQGSPLEKGIYLYRMKVTSTLDGANNEVIRRMVIVN